MMQLDTRTDTLILQGKRLTGIVGMFLRLFILSKKEVLLEESFQQGLYSTN